MSSKDESRLIHNKHKEDTKWLQDIAIKYVNSIEDATLSDFKIWLQGLWERTDDIGEKGEIKALIEGRFTVGISQHDAIENAIKLKKIKLTPVSVRGLDHVLYTEARLEAIREGKNIGEWINEAIKEKLSRK